MAPKGSVFLNELVRVWMKGGASWRQVYLRVNRMKGVSSKTKHQTVIRFFWGEAIEFMTRKNETTKFV